MADYKRLVSYMYNYEDGVKRNNVGYARVESRNGQCKYTLHISAPSLNEKQLKVYIFKRSTNGIEGVLLGTILMRNGVGDFRVMTDSLHIMNSPYGINDMGGMVLYHSNRKFFATEWDGKAVTISMVAQLEEQDAIKKEKAQDDNLKAAGLTGTLSKPREERKESQSPSQLMKEAKPKEEFSKPKSVFEGEDSLEKLINPSFNPVKSKESEVINQEEELSENYEDQEKEESISNNNPVTEEESEKIPETEEVLEEAFETEETKKVKEISDLGEACKKNTTDESKELTEDKDDKSVENIVENSHQETTSKNENQTTQNLNSKVIFEDHPLAKQMYGSFPKMYPFEDNEIAWCVRIEPKDIGMLPMESWALGNNSFLLHGYYSNRHLIFARINDKNGMNYILGVPGIYHNREKYMARMFGFENFKCAKRKQQRTGEFGYWYLPVLLN